VESCGEIRVNPLTNNRGTGTRDFDRDTKFCASFRSALATGGVRTIPLPVRSPNLNAFAEQWVRSVKQECLSKVILFGARPLSRVLAEYGRHYHRERNHQGKDNRLLFPDVNNKIARGAARLNVTTDLAASSNTTDAPHEYLYQTGSRRACRAACTILGTQRQPKWSRRAHQSRRCWPLWATCPDRCSNATATSGWRRNAWQ
jgi:hypothetical protein